MKMYWYCGVKVKGFDTVYSYISDKGEISVGSYVEVPFGQKNYLMVGFGGIAHNKTVLTTLVFFGWAEFLYEEQSR